MEIALYHFSAWLHFIYTFVSLFKVVELLQVYWQIEFVHLTHAQLQMKAYEKLVSNLVPNPRSR